MDILCSAGYVPSLMNGDAPKKIMACKTILFNHSVPAYRGIHMSVIKPENIGDAKVFGFNMRKSDLDELAIQLGHSNDVYRELKVLRERGGQPSQRVMEIVRRYNVYDELKALNEKHSELRALEVKRPGRYSEMRYRREAELFVGNGIPLHFAEHKRQCEARVIAEHECQCEAYAIAENKYTSEIEYERLRIINKLDGFRNVIVDFQYYEFCMDYIIFPECQFADASISTPSISLYNAYCEYTATKYHAFNRLMIFRDIPRPTDAEFAEKFTNATGISQIDGHYRLGLRKMFIK